MTRREAIQRTAALLGLSLSPSTLTTALAQAVTGSDAPPPGPQHLTPARFALVAAMAETLLPRTDTPGAADVGVPAFIDTCYGQFMTDEERERLTTGLDAFAEACRAAHGPPFTDLAPEIRTGFLSDTGRDATGETRAFLRQFREVALLAYYTSEEVSKTVLLYDPIPGRLDADIPLADLSGKAWAE